MVDFTICRIDKLMHLETKKSPLAKAGFSLFAIRE
jgi:hypothetical protein